MDQALNSQKTPHTSPLRASYGMSFVSILMKNDRVIKGFYCSSLRLNHVNKRGPKEQSHTGEKKSITSQPWPLAQAMTCHWTMLMHFRTTNFNIFAIIRTSKWFFGWCQFLSDQIYESTVVRPINGNQSYILSYLPALHIVSKIGAKWIFWKPLDFF